MLIGNFIVDLSGTSPDSWNLISSQCFPDRPMTQISYRHRFSLHPFRASTDPQYNTPCLLRHNKRYLKLTHDQVSNLAPSAHSITPLKTPLRAKYGCRVVYMVPVTTGYSRIQLDLIMRCSIGSLLYILMAKVTDRCSTASASGHVICLKSGRTRPRWRMNHDNNWFKSNCSTIPLRAWIRSQL